MLLENIVGANSPNLCPTRTFKGHAGHNKK